MVEENKLLGKPELYLMLIDKCGTTVTNEIIRQIKAKIGHSFSNTFVNSMSRENNTMLLEKAEIIAEFLDIDVKRIKSSNERRYSHPGAKKREYTWDFELNAKRAIAARKLWKHQIC